MPRAAEIPRLETKDAALSRAWDGLRGVLNPWLRAALPAVVTVSGDYQATAEDAVVLGNAVAGALSVTLPAAASMRNRVVSVKKVDASGNAVTVRAGAGETIDGVASKAITVQWFSYALASNGAAWFIV